MAYKAFKPEIFKKMAMQASKGIPVSYAFGLGKSENAFVLDDSLGPKELFQKVKNEIGASKGSWGVCRIEGAAFVLTPEKKVAGLKKLIKELAKSSGWKWKDCKLVGADGKEVSDEEDDQAPAAEPSAAEPPAARGFVKPDAPAAPKPEPPKEVPAAEVQKIQKTLQVWEKTMDAATKDVRKLQNAILSLKSPYSGAVVRGLERALKKIDGLEGEAKETMRAAGDKDEKGFEEGKKKLARKIEKLRNDIAGNEMLKDADENPITKVAIRSTLIKSLEALARSVA